MFRRPTVRSLPDSVWTVAAAATLAAGALTVRAVSDPSPWLHLKVGQFLVDGGRFGPQDPWAPFAQGHYEPTQWLPSVGTALLYGWWGLPAVAWVRGTGIIALTLALLLTLRSVARTSLALLGAALAVAGSWPALTERPQLAGFVLLAAFSPTTMQRTPYAGVNLAIWYGFALIAVALILALLYGMLCRKE